MNMRDYLNITLSDKKIVLTVGSSAMSKTHTLTKSMYSSIDSKTYYIGSPISVPCNSIIWAYGNFTLYPERD